MTVKASKGFTCYSIDRMSARGVQGDSHGDSDGDCGPPWGTRTNATPMPLSVPRRAIIADNQFV